MTMLQTEDGNATAVKTFGWDVTGSHGGDLQPDHMAVGRGAGRALPS